MKFFFWLALHGRLWMVEHRARHGLQQNDECALCDQAAETTDHLLCSCVFAREVWHRVLQAFALQRLCPAGDRRLPEWWMQARNELPRTLRRPFDFLVLLVAWALWKERNRRTFDNLSKNPSEVLALIREEGEEWAAAGCGGLGILLAAAA